MSLLCANCESNEYLIFVVFDNSICHWTREIECGFMMFGLAGLKVPYEELAVLEVRAGNQAPTAPNYPHPCHAHCNIGPDECSVVSRGVALVENDAVLNPL